MDYCVHTKVRPYMQVRARELRRKSCDIFKLVTDKRGMVARAEGARSASRNGGWCYKYYCFRVTDNGEIRSLEVTSV